MALLEGPIRCCSSRLISPKNISYSFHQNKHKAGSDNEILNISDCIGCRFLLPHLFRPASCRNYSDSFIPAIQFCTARFVAGAVCAARKGKPRLYMNLSAFCPSLHSVMIFNTLLLHYIRLQQILVQLPRVLCRLEGYWHTRRVCYLFFRKTFC